MHNPHNLEPSLYKPVTIANALFIRLGEGNVIFFFFLKQGLVMRAGVIHLHCQMESILFLIYTLPVTLMSLLF